MTYSPNFEGQGEPKNLIIWDIRTGLEKRSFFLNSQMMWPFIRWSHDDKYFARSDEDMLSVYETPVSILFDAFILAEFKVDF